MQDQWYYKSFMIVMMRPGKYQVDNDGIVMVFSTLKGAVDYINSVVVTV